MHVRSFDHLVGTAASPSFETHRFAMLLGMRPRFAARDPHRPSGIFTSSNSKLVCRSSTWARDSHIDIQPRPGCWVANWIADFSGAAFTAQSRLSLWCTLAGSAGGSAGWTGVI